MSGTRYNQFCALARAAEIVGERWTLLIIRELLLSPMRFGDLRERLDDISPALLTDRLNALVEAGVVQRAALPAPFNAQETFEPDWVLLALEAIARRTAVPQCRIGLRVPHPNGTAGFIIEAGPEGTRIAKGESSGIAAIEARFDVLLQILGRHLPLDEAVASGAARIEGSAHTLRKLPSLFELATAKR